MKLIMKPIDHNTTYRDIDCLEKAFFTLYGRLPEITVTGTFTELKTDECVFCKNDACSILAKNGKAVYSFDDIDGAPCKATIEDIDQCILILK